VNISERGRKFIEGYEKLCLTAYMPTPHDVWTIGFGHTKGVCDGQSCTPDQAEAYLLGDLKWVQEAIASLVHTPLSQGQYDALCSLTFNIGATNFGASTLLKDLNAGNFIGAAAQFQRWNKQRTPSGLTELAGLTARRHAEIELFNS